MFVICVAITFTPRGICNTLPEEEREGAGDGDGEKGNVYTKVYVSSIL